MTFQYSGNYNGIFYGKNVDFTGAAQATETVTANGELLIGNGVSPNIRVGTIVSPLGTIDVGYASPNLTLDVISSGFTWTDISGAFFPLASHGYFITGTATGTLPATPNQGDTVKFIVDHASQVLTIQATGTQVIRLGSVVTSVAGSATSTSRGDSITLVYRSTGDLWVSESSVGNWTLSP